MTHYVYVGYSAQIFLDKSQLSCKDLIEPKFYFASEEIIKEGIWNE